MCFACYIEIKEAVLLRGKYEKEDSVNIDYNNACRGMWK